MSMEELFERPQYSISQAEKEELLTARLRELTAWHEERCEPYRRVLQALPLRSVEALADVPYLPVGLFKSHRLSSVREEEIFKTLTSSGTTGQQVSRIVLDRATADRQTRALAAIMTRLLGPARLPMLIVDTRNVVRDRRLFSARGAGVLGMSNFGRRHLYLLDDDMRLDRAALEAFLAEHEGEDILVFGFTFMVWKYLLEPLREDPVDLSRGWLVHSGGWKKLADQAVTNEVFKREMGDVLGLRRVHNFYGMVEQVGSVFLEAPDGYLRPPNFADVIIRDPVTWQEQPHGEPGVVQVLSVLPTSYPGHSILTEDLGVVHGVDDGADGWAGRRLEILGRVPRSELRGCSDTHAQEAMAAS